MVSKSKITRTGENLQNSPTPPPPLAKVERLLQLRDLEAEKTDIWRPLKEPGSYPKGQLTWNSAVQGTKGNPVNTLTSTRKTEEEKDPVWGKEALPKRKDSAKGKGKESWRNLLGKTFLSWENWKRDSVKRLNPLPLEKKKPIPWPRKDRRPLKSLVTRVLKPSDKAAYMW